MNSFQSCRNTTDAIPLYLPQNLYLKPIACINISVQLPQTIEAGKSISTWEIMEKLRVLIKPDEFTTLTVSKSTLEFVRFEAELDDRSKLNTTIALINGRAIKLNAFAREAKIKASEAKIDFPSRHTWDAFFRDAKDMNEMKTGERPDTIHLSHLPIKWFVPVNLIHRDGLKPSQKIFQRIFEKFGHVNCIDIPICDPYRSKMKEHMTGMKTFTFDQEVLFEGYVQFRDYVSFVRAMDAFRGMKLLHKSNSGLGESQTVNIKVDFDRAKHLSEASVRRRQIVRERLIARDRKREEEERNEKDKQEHKELEKKKHELEEKEAKERRQREREEKRKAKHFAQLKLHESEELKKRILKEEKKLLKAQRKLEAIRLISELFARIKSKKEKEAEQAISDQNSGDEITKLKNLRERQVKVQRDKLHRTLEGRVVLNSILGDDNHEHNSTDSNDSTDSDSDSDSNSNSDTKEKRKQKKKKHKKKKSKKNKEKKLEETDKNQIDYPLNMDPYSSAWMGCMNGAYPFPPMFRPPMQKMPPGFYPYRSGNDVPGPSRGFYPRRRGMYNPRWSRNWNGRRGSGLPHYAPELEQEYYKYFRKFLKPDHDDRNTRSYSRTRSRSRSRSRSSSYTRRRRSRSKSRSRSRSRRRSRSTSRSRSRSSYRSRRRKSRTRSRSKSKSSRDRKKSKERSRSKSKEKSRSRSRSRSKSNKSIDSSKFISPNRLRSKRSRSKSWSLPRSKDKKTRSWSKSPTATN